MTWNDPNTFYDQKLFFLWDAFRKQMPGSSQTAFIRSLEDLSRSKNRIGRSKRCNDCHTENSSGAKKCRTCRVDKVDAQDERIRKMGLVNASKQFDRLKYRAKILHYHQDWDIVVMASHKHSRGTSFVTFGTAGLGEEFIGTKEDRARSPTGTAVLDVFSSFVRQRKASEPERPTTSSLPSTSTGPSCEVPDFISDATFQSTSLPSPSSSLSSSVTASRSNVTFSPSIATMLPSRLNASPSSVISSPPIATTSLPPPSSLPSSVTSVSSPSMPSPVTSSLTSSGCFPLSTSQLRSSSNPPPLCTSPPSLVSPPLSTILPSSLTTGPTTSASFGTTIKLPSDAVVVVDNKRVVGVGKSVDLTSVHGHPIPQTHQCVLLTWAQDDYLAPYPVGRKDLKANLFFSKDMFHAVPRTMLKRLNEQFRLVPFSYGHHVPGNLAPLKFAPPPPRGSFPRKFGFKNFVKFYSAQIV